MAVKHTDPTTIEIETTEGVKAALADLVDTGLYGVAPCELAGELLARAVRAELLELQRSTMPRDPPASDSYSRRSRPHDFARIDGPHDRCAVCNIHLRNVDPYVPCPGETGPKRS